MNWNPVWFAIAVVGCVLLLLVKKKAILVPILAVVVYLGVHFNIWQWLTWLFWASSGISLVLSLFLAKQPKLRKPSIAVGALALVIAVLAATSSVVGWANPWGADDKPSSSSNSETSADADETSEEDSESSADAGEATPPEGDDDILTVRSTNVDCIAIVKAAGDIPFQLPDGSVVYEMKEEALAPVGVGARSSATAVALPVTNPGDPVSTIKDAALAICRGSLYGGQVKHLFANEIIDGKGMVERNPWLEPSEGDASLINDVATTYVGDHEGVYYLTVEYQVLAEFTVELLIRGQLAGVTSEESELNYQLEAAGLTIGPDQLLPEVELNPTQESLPAVVIEYWSKEGRCLLRIGINERDKRLEKFPCNGEPPSCNDCPPPDTTTPQCDSCTTTTTIPEAGKANPPEVAPTPSTWVTTATTMYCAYGLDYWGGCRLFGDDSGVGSPEPEYPSGGPTPTSEPPGSVPPTSAPPAPHVTVTLP